MNGFFTDNQTKQKAYDRYYNAMAKSDFVQGAKLKAMNQQQALDDASSDSLANLFQQVMSKSRDYDYDQITSKLTKKAPPVVKGDEGKPPKAPKETKSNSPSTKKYKYVPHQTDTDANMEAPPNFTYEEMFNDDNFMKHMSNFDYTKMNKGMNMEEAFQDRIRRYLQKNKEFRSKVFMHNRKTTKEEIDDKANEIAKAFLKRKRDAPAPDETSPNLRPKTRIKQEEMERKMSSADLGADKKE
ncbi:unnamed protein product [Phytophthora lilii]|uniref:Unnamed protein product n=1 Tax=Phytophthora lilii TaxID=2077276 RepID=A0A9W6WMU2_9STRA|nr:unnamed protein product [Phytophthora lilii]